MNFESNMGLVTDVYNKNFKKYEGIKEDLLQEGYIGLFKACKNFKEEKGFKFSTFAFRCIKNEMMIYEKKQKHIRHEILDDDIFEKYADRKTYNIYISPKLPHKEVVNKLVAGYSQRAIAKQEGVKMREITNKIKEIRESLIEKG